MTSDAHTSSSDLNGSGSASSQDVAQSLQRIESRLDRLEDSIARVTALLDQAPPMMATVADIVDDELRQATDQGVDVDQRLRQLTRLSAKLTDPAILNSLEKLADRADSLETLVNLIDDLPDGMAMAMDIFDEFIDDARARGIDPVRTLAKLESASLRFARFVQSDQFSTLMDSHLLEPSTVDVLSRAATALAEASDPAEEHSAGFFALLRATRDDDVRSAMGFAIAFARRFGEHLDQPSQLLLEE